jgi:MFS family permease
LPQSISADLNASVTASFALATSFLLAATVFQPFFSEISHVIGRKLTLLAALIVFAVGSIVVATSSSPTQLLIGRAIQGAGGAGPISLTVVILTDIFELRERAGYIGGLNAVWTIGSISGPLIGGVFVRYSSWVCFHYFTIWLR